MKDEKSRAALMTACTLSVIQLMELHRDKTGTPMEHMLIDMLALPICITMQVSEAEHAEDNMLLTMAGYRQLVKDYENEEIKFNEKAQPHSSRALH